MSRNLEPNEPWDLEGNEPKPKPGQSAAQALVETAFLAAQPPARELEEKHQPVKLRIARDQSVQAALSVARTAQAAFQSTLKGLTRLLDRDAYTEAHKRVINESIDPNEIEAATRALSALDSDAFIIARSRAMALASAAYGEFKPTITPILDAAGTAVAELEAEAIKAEQSLFAAFGMRREPTAVSRRIEAVREAVKGFRNGLIEQASTGVHSVHLQRNALNHILDYFTV